MNKLKQLYLDSKYMLGMFVIYLTGTALDFLSSLGPFPPGVFEQNPLARHPNGTFWPAHAGVEGLIFTLELILLSLWINYGLRPLDTKLAKVAAGLPFLYYAYLHLDAAVGNLLLKLLR